MNVKRKQAAANIIPENARVSKTITSHNCTVLVTFLSLPSCGEPSSKQLIRYALLTLCFYSLGKTTVSLKPDSYTKVKLLSSLNEAKSCRVTLSPPVVK